MEKQLLSRVRPLIYTEGNKAYTNNGSILLGYRLTLPEIFTLDEGDFENLQSMWYRAIKDLPVGSIIHKMDLYLKDQFFFPNKEKASFLQDATVKHFNGRQQLIHHSLLFYILPNPNLLNNTGIINPFKKPVKTQEAVENFEKSRKFFSEDVEKSIDFINASRYIKTEALSPEEFKYLEAGYFNGFYEDRFTDYDIKNSLIGDKKIGAFVINSLGQLGETVKTSIEDPSMSERDWIYHQGFMDSLALKLKCDHIYNQVIYVRDHHKEKKNIEKKKDEFFGSRKFEQAHLKDSEKLQEFLSELADDEKIRLVYGHNNIIFYAKQDEYDHLNSTIPTLFKGVDIIPYYPTGRNRSNVIANSFPGFIPNLDLDNFYGPIDLQQVLCLFTNVSNYRNDETGIYFNERLNNIPVRKDIWDSERKRIKARNFFIVAPTGEGKSVLFNHIARQMYENGTAIVIIDLGGSYRKLSLLYPGQTVYIRYKEGQPIGLNPFKLEIGEEISTEKIEELANFIFKIWKKERMPEDGESVALKKILNTYYKNVHSGHCFPDFYQFIEQYQDTLQKKLEITQQVDLKDFLHICSEFIENGIYAFLFKDS